MSGVTYLNKLQLGREATAGTPVAATTIGRWEGAYLKDDLEVYFPPEHVGLLVDTDRSCIPVKGASITVPENTVTFEQFLHILEMGIKTDTPAQDGAGDGYIYEYPFPTTAQLTTKTYTLEAGNDQEQHEMEYCFIPAFTISGKIKETLKFSADIIGRQATVCDFTGALSIPSVEEMLFQKCKFYINDVGSGFGGTLLSNTILGFSLSVDSGFQARYTAGGNLYFSYIKQVKPTVSLSLTMEHNATADAEITNGRAETARAIRILCEGSAFGTGGTTYANKTMIIDLGGKYSAIPQIEDDDGSSVLNFEFAGKYNSTLAKLGQITVVTDLASIP